MKKHLKILSLLLLPLSMMAQESRLYIGERAKMPVVSTSISTYIKPIVKSELNVDKNTAVGEFYKSLLIKNTGPKPAQKVANVVVFENKSNQDNLYSDENISVSNVYPNPANDFTKVEYHIKNRRSKASLTINNIVGGQLSNYSLDPNEREITISTRDLENGIYFYQLIVDGHKVATKKMLVRHF